ncbi:MAG: autotransporter outer membrane beta-barrel domain-containing protein, partial [Pseudomonadota bacterium]
TPFASLTVNNRSVSGFQETNGGVLVGDFDQTSLVGKIGARATLTIDIDQETMFFVSGDIAAAYDFLDDDELGLVNNGTLPNERVEAIDDLSAQYGAMIGFDFTRESVLFLGYNGGFSANTLQHALSGGAVINF